MDGFPLLSLLRYYNSLITQGNLTLVLYDICSITSKLAWKYVRERCFPLFKCLIVYFEGTSEWVCTHMQHKNIREGNPPFWCLLISHSLKNTFGVAQIYLELYPKVPVCWNTPQVSYYTEAVPRCFLKAELFWNFIGRLEVEINLHHEFTFCFCLPTLPPQTSQLLDVLQL